MRQIGYLMMSGKNIIIYKNDINLRQSFALILKRAGYKIVTTDNVNKAVELIKSKQYQLVISDTDVPDTRSILLPKIQDLKEPILAVIFTDKAISIINQERQSTNIHYLEKPVAPERLLELVDGVISQK